MTKPLDTPLPEPVHSARRCPLLDPMASALGPRCPSDPWPRTEPCSRAGVWGGPSRQPPAPPPQVPRGVRAPAVLHRHIHLHLFRVPPPPTGPGCPDGLKFSAPSAGPSDLQGPGTGAGWVPLLGAAQALCEHLPPAESTCWVLGPSWVLQREQHRVVCWVRAQVLGGDRCPLPTASSPACGAQPLWCLGDDAPRSPGLLQHLISGVPDCPQGSPTLPTPWVKPRHLKCPAWFRLGWVGQGRALRGGGLRGGLRGPVGASQAREWAGLGKATPELQREVCASTGWRTGL